MPAEGADAARQRRALDLVASLLVLPPADRPRVLDELCRGDGLLRGEVESLLDEDELALDLHAAAGLDVRGVASGAFAAAAAERGSALPERIGPYRVLGLLGEGGMGLVLEAEQDQPRRRVAVKVLSRLAASPKAQRRFEREADIMAQLAHPAIARVYAAGRFETDLGPQPFLAMELVDGEPLTEYARRRALSLRERVELMVAVADAVEHAHAHGVVHRDLKPANILVTPAGRPKVLDFGVARAHDTGGDRTEPMTGTGQMIGTLAYMSPEQVAGGATVDAQSDVHALGVLLYELLVGRLPHEVDGLPLPEAARVLRDEDPPRPSSLAPELRGDLEAVILVALAQDRQRRYRTAEALATDLRRWLAGEPVLARHEGAIARTRRFVRRHAALTAAVAAVILTLAAGLVAVAWQAARATRLAREERRRAYVADIHAADAALDMRDSRRARRHLDAAPAAFRDWEWRHLRAQLDVAERTQHAGGAAQSVILSPDGTTLVAAANPGPCAGRARAWDAATGEPRGTPVSTSALRAAGFDPWGHAIGLAVEEGAVSLVDLESGTELRRLELDVLSAVHREEDLGALALGGAVVAFSVRHVHPERGTSVFTWSPSTGEVALRMRFHAESPRTLGPTQLALSPSGESLAASTYSGDLHVVKLDGTEPTRVITGLTQQPLRAIAFSPDERLVLWGGQDNSAGLVDLRSRVVVGTLDGHRGPVTGAAWSPDGARLHTASDDHVVRTWDRATGRLVEALLGHEAPVTCVVPSSDGTRLISGASDGSVKTWNLARTGGTRVLAGHESFVYPIAWSRDGRRLWSGSWDGTVREWDPVGGTAVSVPFATDVPVVALAASPDGSRLAIGVAGPDAILLDTRTGARVGALGPHDRRAAGLAFAPDGRTLATVSWDNRLRLWDVAKGTVSAQVEGLDETYEQSVPVAYSPDGSLIAFPWADASVRLVELPSLRVRTTLEGHTAHVNAIAFSPDGSLVAAGSDDHTARTWDTASGRPVAVLVGHASKVHAVAFDAEGTRLATGSKDGTVRLWDPHRGDDLLVLEGHRDYVYSAAFSPDGRRLATGSGDGTVRVWDAPPESR